MTLAAVVMIWALNPAYTASTTTPFFIFSNIPAPIFLGLHLLVTDPATSPRTGLGKLIFGGLYGLGAFAFYGILVHLDSLSVYDKLLPVPLLNLGVRVIDGFVRNVKSIPWLQVLTGQGSRGLNVLHMGAWVVVFTTMLTTSYVQGKHEGGTIEFWKRKLAEGRPGAGKALVEVLKSQSRDNYAPAWNELGILYLQGQLVARDPVVAARCFTRACKLGSIPASANIAAQFLGNPSAKSARVIELAFDRLEKECAGDTDPVFYQLVGFAYETGRARPRDLERARMYYEKGCAKKNREACNALSRLSASGPPPETR
jgi:hypothetical protein